MGERDGAAGGADRILLPSAAGAAESQQGGFSAQVSEPAEPPAPEGFTQLTDDDIPF